MFDIFLNAPALPPRLYLHSYTGSAGMVDSLSRMKRFGPRFYFGFSTFVNARSPKTRDVLRAVPADRLLLESDLEDSGPMGADRKRDLEKMVLLISEARGWGIEETWERTYENARNFYKL
mmetsp:Transcript_75817/g.152350  ORF Transcript_75817/g.152350 Transcript_75817/m.152350 type:complete len:120 (+) Transcript_75817:3-362(+)